MATKAEKPEPFRRFEELTKKLLSVPKKDVDKKKRRATQALTKKARLKALKED